MTASMAPTVSWPARCSPSRINAHVRKANWVRTISPRRGTRSARAPPHGPSRNVGPIWTAARNAGHLASCVASWASQMSVVICVHDPTSETSWPQK